MDKLAKTVEINFWKSGLRDREMQGDDDRKESEPEGQYFLTAGKKGLPMGEGNWGSPRAKAVKTKSRGERWRPEFYDPKVGSRRNCEVIHICSRAKYQFCKEICFPPNLWLSVCLFACLSLSLSLGPSGFCCPCSSFSKNFFKD